MVLIGTVVLHRRSEEMPWRPSISSHMPPAATKNIGLRASPELEAEMRNAVSRGSPAMAGERRITARWSTMTAGDPDGQADRRG